MTSSLIRSGSQVDQRDYSTVFYINIIASTFLYLLVFLFAPFVADFYSAPILKNLLRLYSISFIINSFVAVQTTILTKELNFKMQMKMQIPSVILGAAVGLFLALKGFGVWSLVWLNLAQASFFTIQHWMFTKWRPSLVFDFSKLKKHFSFGYKLTLSSLIDTIYNNAYNIVIGKFFSPTTVGFYNQADNMRLFPVGQISNALNKVTYPLFTSINDNEVKLKEAYRKAMQYVLLFIVPIMISLIVIAEPLFRVVLGQKWLPAVPFFQILCIASVIRPIGSYNLNILKVKGKSGTFLQLEVIKKAIGIITLFVSLRFGIYALVWGLTISSFFFAFLNGFFSGKLINYPLSEQLKNVYIFFLAGAVSGLIMYLLGTIEFIKGLNDFALIIMLASGYFLVYGMLVGIAKREVFLELKSLLKRKG